MDKKLVFPGEKIADDKILSGNTFYDGKASYAAVIGTLDKEGRYIPLVNRYRPGVGDVVIGVVTDVRHAGYSVDMGLPQTAMIPSRTMRTTLQLGDFVLCKVKSVNEVGDVDLGEVRRLPRGKMIGFPPAKVPRLIGRKSSMLMLLTKHIGGDILVGNNGFVWISDKSNMPLALRTIRLIERKAHKSGLTDKVAAMLEKETGIKIENAEEEKQGE